jgi:hypothetical protein
MSYEPEQESQEGAEGADGTDAGADDLNGLQGGGEMAFVAETKQPMNKGTLIVVGLLIACGAATYFMYVKSGPDQAVAQTDPSADALVKGFLDGSGKNVQQMETMLKATEKVVQQFRSDAGGGQVPLSKLATNPFMKEKPKPREDRALLEKAEQLRLMAAQATEAVRELRLQTIIHRDPKKATCMINNTLYRKGQRITVADGKVTFTIEEVRPDGVTVSAPGGEQPLKFELKMKQ